MFVPGHVDFASNERNAFGLQANPLLRSGLTRQQNFSAGAEDAMPRKASIGLGERPGNAASIAGKSGGFGHGSIRRDFALGNFRDNAPHFFEHFEIICGARTRACRVDTLSTHVGA